ncbi:hypothetical protein JCM8547_007263 [Rhodosporidiobolus lusitaniae]
MPSVSNLRKRASASLDAYSAQAAGPPPTRTQRALSRLSRLKIPLRSPTSHSDLQQTDALRPSPPPSSSSSPRISRPNKLRRQSRSLSVSTTLTFFSSGTPYAPPPTPALLEADERQRDSLDVERLKRTISYPILQHATNGFDGAEGGWGVREATNRRDGRSSVLSGRSGGGGLGWRKRSNTVESSFKLAFPVLGSKHGEEDEPEQDEPFGPYQRIGTRSLTLDVSLAYAVDSFASQHHRTDEFDSTYSISNYDDEQQQPTSRFSFDSSSLKTSPSLAGVPAPYVDPAECWRDSGDSSSVHLDYDFDYLPSSPVSPVAVYKNQPLASSTPLTPTSPSPSYFTPLSPHALVQSLRDEPASPSPFFSPLAAGEEEDLTLSDEPTGFSFARTSPSILPSSPPTSPLTLRKQPTLEFIPASRARPPTVQLSNFPILPTPPPTPKARPDLRSTTVAGEADISALQLPGPLVEGEEHEEEQALRLTAMLEDLVVEQEEEKRREQEEEGRMAVAQEMEAKESGITLWPGADPRRSSIPFPAYSSSLSDESLASSPLSDTFPLSPSPPPRSATPTPALLFLTSSTSSTSSSIDHEDGPKPFTLDSPPAARTRGRVLRRVTHRVDLSVSLPSSSPRPDSVALLSPSPLPPPTSPLPPTPTTPSPVFLLHGRDSMDLHVEGEGEVDTPTKGKFFTTPTPATPRATVLFPSLEDERMMVEEGEGREDGMMESPSRRRIVILSSEDVEEDGEAMRDEGEVEKWTTLLSSSAGGEGSRRRSF